METLVLKAEKNKYKYAICGCLIGRERLVCIEENAGKGGKNKKK